MPAVCSADATQEDTGGPCFEQESMSLEVLRTLAAAMTIIAAGMVAANWNARITVCGFAHFIAASLAWIADPESGQGSRSPPA